MEQDLLDINAKYDSKIADLEQELSDLRTEKQSKQMEVKAYYEALGSKAGIDAIVSKGKPII